MKYLTANAVGAFLSAIASFGSGGGTAYADNPLDVQDAVAEVIVSGVLSQSSEPVEVHGTGFFISEQAYLVTSYHLKEKLGEGVIPDTIRYEVNYTVDGRHTLVQAFLQESRPASDILVLYVPVNDVIHPLRKSSVPVSRIIYSKEVHVLSEIPGVGLSPRGGHVTNKTGVLSSTPVWAVDMSFVESQSGSPVLWDDNTVVAVVKGNYVDTAGQPGAGSFGFVVPISVVSSNWWEEADKAAPSEPATGTNEGSTAPAQILVQQADVKPTAGIRKIANVVFANDQCSDSSDKTRHFVVDPGGHIDPKSISLESISTDGNATAAIHNITTVGFDIVAHLQNVGSCAGTTADTPASYTGRVSYTIIFNQAVTQTVTLSDTKVNQAPSATFIEIPNSSANKLFYSATDSTGKSVPFTPQSDELVRTNGVTAIDAVRVVRRLFGQ